METRVVNRRYSGDDVIYIGRPSRWGNAYAMASEADRDRVCDLHEMQLALDYVEHKITDADLDGLRGKALRCFCAPKRCHGDTLKKVADMEPEERRKWALGYCW